MTHLFLAVISLCCEPLAVRLWVKNTVSQQTAGIPDLASPCPNGKSVYWYSDTQWTLYCRVHYKWRGFSVAGQSVNDAHWDPVVTKMSWLNMDRRTLAVSQSQRNATADYPPFHSCQTPLPCLVRDTFVSYDKLHWLFDVFRFDSCLTCHNKSILVHMVNNWVYKNQSPANFVNFCQL